MTATLPSKILIIGATGVIGKYITNGILAAKPRISSLTSVSIFTSPATASSPAKEPLLSQWKSQGLNVITGDINSAADVCKAYDDHDIDTVVSGLGRGGLVEQMELLRWADASKSVRWFFPSEYGTDIEYDETSKDEKPHKNKLAVRKFIRDEIKKVKCTYVVTGPYPEMWVHPQPAHEDKGGYDVKKKEAWIIGDGTDKIGFTTMPDVGKFVAAALAHPEVSMGKILKVQSFVVPPLDFLAEFEKQTGSKFKVNYTPMDQIRAQETKAWTEGSPVATLYTLRRIWSEGKTLYEKTDNESLGVKQSDLEMVADVVKRAVDGVPF